MTPVRRTMLVALLAALGIVLAAAITWGTSQLVRQHIGLSSEPLTAGRSLLPPLASERSRTTSTRRRTTPAPSTTPTSTTPTAPSTTTPTAPTTTAPPAYTPPTTTTSPSEQPSQGVEPPAAGGERSRDGGGGDSRARSRGDD